MYYLFLTIHITACLFLIMVVLLQTGKGAEMGAAFGGSTQTIFGARGAATFLSKLTTGAAIVFMLTSFSLALMASKSETVIPQQTAPAALDEPFVPPTDQLFGEGESGPVSEGAADLEPTGPEAAKPAEGTAPIAEPVVPATE